MLREKQNYINNAFRQYSEITRDPFNNHDNQQLNLENQVYK